MLDTHHGQAVRRVFFTDPNKVVAEARVFFIAPAKIRTGAVERHAYGQYRVRQGRRPRRGMSPDRKRAHRNAEHSPRSRATGSTVGDIHGEGERRLRVQDSDPPTALVEVA